VSKHGPCQLSHHDEPAVAWWRGRNGHTVWLCQGCLDHWFDNADDDPALEPAAWGWFYEPRPAAADIAAWARDPRNHQAVAEILRREARIDPSWLRNFVHREWRRGSILALA
jgi:hypothetical protein